MTPRALTPPQPLYRELGQLAYLPVWERMQQFTDGRTPETPDEFWFLEHPPVFTQGVRGTPENILDAGSIPVVQIDRGGQVTYHGPGQLVVYTLLDLRRLGIGPRGLVERLETALIRCLQDYGIHSETHAKAHGVYVGKRKIASLGLRVRKGCSFHGLALNVHCDLKPFTRINPCGYRGLEMARMDELGGPDNVGDVGAALRPHLLQVFGYANATHAENAMPTLSGTSDTPIPPDAESTG